MLSFYYNPSIGDILISEEEGYIIELGFISKDIKNELESKQSETEETKLIIEVKKQLNEYFEGKRKIFDVPTRQKGTKFMQDVYEALQKIPYGQTVSYKDIAKMVGSEKAYRAVGNANNKNSIAIIIPCHRVIGENGKLVGYAGGIEIKEALLFLENSNNNHG
jgi:methylated-DNA-[protein]-cysteine S-methyltransferase